MHNIRLIRLIVLIGVLAFWSPLFAQTVDCGTTGTGTVDSNGWSNFQAGRSCTTGGNSAGYTVQSCSIRLGAEPTAANIRCAIYNNTADPNKALLCQGGPQAATPNATNTITLSGCGTLTASTVYWITHNNDQNDLAYRDVNATACTGVTTDFFVASTFGAAPNPWGTRGSDTCENVQFMTLNTVTTGRNRYLSD